MKKRKNFFQVFSFSFILQGFYGEKIVAEYHFGSVNAMVVSITKPRKMAINLPSMTKVSTKLR